MSKQLWARVECLCGEVAAIPECGRFPLCGSCGRRMVAPYDPSRVCYVVEPQLVNDAVRDHREETGESGVFIDNDLVHAFLGQQRLYDDESLRKVLSQRDWPTEAQDWPEVTNAAGSYKCPPWEAPDG